MPTVTTEVASDFHTSPAWNYVDLGLNSDSTYGTCNSVLVQLKGLMGTEDSATSQALGLGTQS